MEGTIRITKVALVGLVSVAIALGLGYWLYGLGGSEAQAQGETGTCPNAQQIDQFTGTGSQTSDTFETTSDSLRLSYELTSTGDLGEPSLIIGVRDAEEDIPVASASQREAGTGESFVNEPPGTYFLDITLVGEGRYTVTVEQCESGDPPSTNPTPGTPKESSQPKTPSPAPKTPSPAPKTPSLAPKTPAPAPKDSGTLMNAGGPTTGPMPMMPNGSCPREFPEIREGACYLQ